MLFTKMHGIGNDFVVVDGVSLGASDRSFEAEARAKFLCDRKFGIGADGVILIMPSNSAQFRMRMFNPDGSEAEMCGNGIRCFAKYVYDQGLSKEARLDVETGAGLLTTDLIIEDETVQAVRVDMGPAILDRKEIPVNFSDDGAGAVISHPLMVDGYEYLITCVSMGNPHCVVFVDDVARVPLTHIGPLFERNSVFPNRTNTEFVEVLSESEIHMRVWERGAAETLACGTGACASAVASALNGKTGRDTLVHLAGGDLRIEWLPNGRVLMTGPATTVYSGDV